MTPIQQLYLGVGASDKTYTDDVFSTYLYKGNGSARTITNGINFSEDGGMLWSKARSGTDVHKIFDTARGYKNSLETHNNNAQWEDSSAQYYLSGFNNNGFGWASGHGNVNQTNTTYSTWSFKKTPGFFDVITYTGNGTAGRQIAHSLASVPGMIMVKRTSGASNWAIFHRGTDATAPEDYWMTLNADYARQDQPHWNDTKPTSTHFTVGNDYEVNANNQTYVAYIFAGGESTGTGAGSVYYGGGPSYNDYSYFVDHNDFNVGTNFTAECWFKANSLPSGTSYNVIMGQWFDASAWILEYVGTDLRFYASGLSGNYKSLGTTSGAATLGQWHHVAISKQGTTTRIFLNGKQVVADFDMGTHSVSSKFYIGGHASGNTPVNGAFDGWISNVRVVKDTAVYTSSFRPPTEPLTGITNTVILCCNDPTNDRGTTVNTTGDYMYGGTSQSDPSERADSPFDDPAAFTFGDSKEGIIKCGSYVGLGDIQSIDLGWEPQFVMLKRTDGTAPWNILDNMRGISTGANDNWLEVNATSAEQNGVNLLELTPTGFKIMVNGSHWNGTNNKYIYMAIRRPDGYVGKPYKLGTSVFGLTTGAGSTSRPSFVPNFPVDFNIFRKPAEASQNWQTSARLTAAKAIYTNLSNAEQGHSDYVWDSNVGVFKDAASDYQAWSWKRHAGFDVVTYKGNAVSGRVEPHSLGKIPEMMWVKNRSRSESWYVYHKDNGTNPKNRALNLNTTSISQTGTFIWNDTLPTSTHFTVGNDFSTNGNNDNMLALLFSSVSGISKVGSYNGSGSSGNAQNIGFQPRFLFVRRIDDTGAWYVFDSIRTTSAPFRRQLELNTSNTQDTVNKVTVSSTGWSFTDSNINESGSTYIYYAHA